MTSRSRAIRRCEATPEEESPVSRPRSSLSTSSLPAAVGGCRPHPRIRAPHGVVAGHSISTYRISVHRVIRSRQRRSRAPMVYSSALCLDGKPESGTRPEASVMPPGLLRSPHQSGTAACCRELQGEGCGATWAFVWGLVAFDQVGRLIIPVSWLRSPTGPPARPGGTVSFNPGRCGSPPRPRWMGSAVKPDDDGTGRHDLTRA